MKPFPPTPLIEIDVPSWTRNDEMRLWVKDESARVDDVTGDPLNATGTWKDRKSQLILNVLDRANLRIAQKGGLNVEHIAIVSSGNAALSMAQHLVPCGYKVHVLLTVAHMEVKQILCDAGADVQMIDPMAPWLSDDEIAEIFGLSLPEFLLVATLGFHDAYRGIIAEIDEQMEEKPSAVILPFGTGEAMLGIIAEIQKRRWETLVLGIRDVRNVHLGGQVMDRRIFDHINDASLRGSGVLQDLPITLSKQDIAVSIPSAVCSESAAATPFAWFHNLLRSNGSRSDYDRQLLGKRIVIVNSGYGVLQESLDRLSVTTQYSH